MLKAQRHAVDRIVQRYRRLGAVLLDPDVGDDELRARLLSIVPEEKLREDQSDLASWTRGDRKARFEQTAERHAGLSQHSVSPSILGAHPAKAPRAGSCGARMVVGCACIEEARTEP